MLLPNEDLFETEFFQILKIFAAAAAPKYPGVVSASTLSG
jgi:hypothetical protein